MASEAQAEITWRIQHDTRFSCRQLQVCSTHNHLTHQAPLDSRGSFLCSPHALARATILPMNGVKLIEEYCDSLTPGLWQLCYPRTYDGLSSKFHSPKIPAASLANAVISSRKFGMGYASISNHYVVAALCQLHLNPTFFVPRKVFDAANATDLPPDMRWTDIKMPHPGLIFIFERGTLPHPTQGEVAFAAVARPTRGMKIQHSYPDSPIGYQQNGGFILLTATHESPGFDQFDVSISEERTPTIKDIARLKSPEFNREPDAVLGERIEVNEMDFNYWLTILCMKLLLVMSARPELVSHGKHLHTAKSKRQGEAGRQFWTPNIIGHSYSPKEERGELVPTGIKKRMHWRRGHFARQAYGSHYAEHRTIWREPVLVGTIPVTT